MEERHDEELTEELTEKFQKNYEKEKSTRGWWIKTILMLLLVCLSVVMLFTLGDYLTGEDTPQLTLPQLFSEINFPLFLLLIAVVLLYFAVESGKYAWMLKVQTGKFRPRVALKTMFLGKYYDGITPMSTGGQPFQIYYLHKKGTPIGTATAIPILRYIVSIIFLSALSIVLLSLSPSYLPQNTVNRTVLILSWISLAINILFPTVIVLFSIFPRTGKKLIALSVHGLSKLHIVKERYKTTEKLVRGVDEYSSTIRKFMREIYKYFPLLMLCVAESLLYVLIPFFVVIAIANVPPTVELAVQIACLVVITRYTALLVPTPGNTGAAEAASSLVFVTVSEIGSVIGWVILVWRFFTYYVYILTGIGISIFEIVRSAVRNRRERTK